MKIPKIIEINTLEYLNMLNTNQMLEHDLIIYSNIISKILDLPIEIINGKNLISADNIVEICEKEMKKLLANKEQ